MTQKRSASFHHRHTFLGMRNPVHSRRQHQFKRQPFSINIGPRLDNRPFRARKNWLQTDSDLIQSMSPLPSWCMSPLHRPWGKGSLAAPPRKLWHCPPPRQAHNGPLRWARRGRWLVQVQACLGVLSFSPAPAFLMGCGQRRLMNNLALAFSLVSFFLKM